MAWSRTRVFGVSLALCGLVLAQSCSGSGVEVGGGRSTAEQDLGLDELPVPDARCVASFPERLLFGSGKSVILPASSEPIEALSKVMLEVPGMKVAVVGYADWQEHDRVRLSRARATSVVDRLVAREVASERLSVVARGADAPIVLDGPEEDRAANRRVIFIVTDCAGTGRLPPGPVLAHISKTCRRGDAGAPVSGSLTKAGRVELGPDGGAKFVRLAPEIIQAIVRDRYPAMRTCYEIGLRSNQNLQGKVSTHFVINIDGTVSNVSDEASTLPDPKVVRCVLDVFNELCFPSPEGGIVTVVYPIMFSPGD